MVEMSATIRNAHGIHCRPSTLIIKTMTDYTGSIVAGKGGRESDLRSVVGLVCLGLLPGEQVHIRVSGPDEEAICRQVVELFETTFDFPPRSEDVTPSDPAPSSLPPV